MKYNSETKFIGHYKGLQIFDVIKDNLNTCDEFYFSVSFIRESGLVLLVPEIEKALKRGARGTIITTDYMRVTQENSLRILYDLGLKYAPLFNAYFLEKEKSVYESFHTKGYVFRKDNIASIIVGSSNISRAALGTKSGEWSLYSKTLTSDALFKNINFEFKENVKNISGTLTLKQIEDYVNCLDVSSFGDITPNYMQQEALKALNDLRVVHNKKRALIVAAMGSGKTYLSAFDSKASKANNILYVCHSETILNNAMDSFKKVFKDTKTYGKYVGGKHETDKNIIFATNQSLAKHLGDFTKDYFDYIIIDEAHHAPADTFNSIITYFNPDFLLGMTGTPDRCDQKNVREKFGSELPYELNLKDAIQYKLIMPFKYYSVYDGLVDYSTSTSDNSLIKHMTSYNHGDFVDRQIKAHIDEIQGKLKCLAFCVNVQHAKTMANLMKTFGYNTAYVYGGTSQDDRKSLFTKLQNEKDPLQIIFSCNVMNEGVDLPKINMSLFLRPTESSIIFIQQLGRGLRLSENKNKPVIIDFIGNKYERSIYIAWALGGLTNAPVLTKPILKGIIDGEITSIKDLGVELNFDEESKKEIIESVDNHNFNRLDILKKSYDDFKTHYNFASTFPSHTAFVKNSSGFDLIRIIKTHKSYYNFLRRIKEFNVPKFTKIQTDFIEYLCEMLPLSRPYEFTIVRTLVDNGDMTSEDLKKTVLEIIGKENFNDKVYDHAIDFLLLKTESEKNFIAKPHYLLFDNNIYSLKLSLKDKEIFYKEEYGELDFNDSIFRTHILDLLNYGIFCFYENYASSGNGFELYKTYSRKEFTRVSCMESVYSFQPGVIYSKDKTKVTFFIDLIKKKGVEEHLDYGDKFLTNNTLYWESQTGTWIGSNKYNKLMALGVADIFVRKTQVEDGIGLPYVYIGKGKLKDPQDTENPKKTVKFTIELENKLPDYLFEQFNIDSDK